MTKTSPPSYRHRAAWASLASILLLAGCAGAPQTSEPTKPPSSSTSTAPVTSYSLELPRSEWEGEFANAETALAQNDWMSADVALSELQEAPLNPDDRARLVYMEARMAHLRGDQALARSSLDRIDRPGLHPALAYRVKNFKRHMLGLSGDFMGSAKLGASLLQTAPSADRAALKRSVWHDLQRLDGGSLEVAAAQTTDPDWAGWLSLAALANRDPNQLRMELPSWLASNPGHAAANPLPGGLQYLEQSPRVPEQVALMLPLSGRLAPAGKAVRDGYLCLLYTSDAADD